MRPEIGDKVRLKTSEQAGRRGIIESLLPGAIVVLLDENERVSVAATELTNFSLAARKAWQNMPDRQVGRPKGTGLRDRMSVTLRIDRELWDWFRRLESAGVVEDRTTSINQWIRERLAELDTAEPLSNGKKN